MDKQHADIADAEDFAPAQLLAGASDSEAGQTQADPSEEGEPDEDEDRDDSFEIEMDGKVHTLPATLKGAFLRQADYTRKTQELAEHRRAVAVERAEVAAQAHSAGQVSSGQVQLAALDHQLASFRGIDWQACEAQDPQGVQALWDRFQGMVQARERLAETLSHHAARGELQAAQETAAKMAQAGQVLRREIEGWSPEVAGKLIDYAKAFGVTHDELARTADPRLWKVLHKAWQADQASRDEGVASAAARAQAVRPAVTVAGAAAGGGGVRDELATKEWMKRRNELVWKGR